MTAIYFLSETKRSHRRKTSFTKLVKYVVTSHLLFVHALTGCDTTSATFGQRKTSLLEKITDSEELQQIDP